MKFAIPEISWHNRDPVLSVDFQPKSESGDPLRLATGGTDSHVLIWYISTTETGSVNLEVAADLTRHQKAVNVVRWSPSGQLLASGDDESIIFIWKHKTDKEPAPVEQGEEQHKETWVIHKTLRGHMEDVLDLSWSADSQQLASGSVDNKLVVWDVARGRYSSILADHKGFVQGVAWDPRGQMIASASTDRVFRTFDLSTKKVLSRSSKATLPFPADHPLHEARVRLYHDDTLQTYYRRLQFSPDGLLIAVPGGRIEPEQGRPGVKPIDAVYIYTRYSLKAPACVLPCGEPALVTRWSPRVYTPRSPGPAPALPSPAGRMLLAVATRRSVLLYDTQQKTPMAVISNIHYTRLTDLSWSPDGRTLVASSTDGFCSVIMFGEGELGEVLPEPVHVAPTAETMEIQGDEPQPETPKEKAEEPKPSTPKIDSFVKPRRQKIESIQQKTPVKLDVLVETAMPSWSDNSSSEIIKPREPMEVDQPQIEVIEVEDSEDIKLVYEDTQDSNKDVESPQMNNTTTETNKTTSETKNTSTKIENTSPETKNTTPEAKITCPNIKKSSPETENTTSVTKNTSPKNKNKSPKNKNTSPKNKNTSPETKHTTSQTKNTSPERKSTSPEQVNTPTSTNFLQQAKVTDIREPAGVKAVPSPKAPRRVSFVTLSSPKNKKKC